MFDLVRKKIIVLRDLVKFMHFFRNAVAFTQLFNRFVRLDVIARYKEAYCKAIRLAFKLSGIEKGMVIQKKTIDPPMQTIVPQFMGAYESLPLVG